MHRVFVFAAVHNAHAHNARDEVDGLHDQRKQNSLEPEDGIERRAQNHRPDIFRRRRFENVRPTARAIADIVADKVRNYRRVARIVFGNACLDLADQVRAHIRGFGIDAAAQLREERYQRRAESETHQLVGNLLRIMHSAKCKKQQAHADQRQSHNHETRHRSAAQGDLERVAHARASRCRCPDIRADRNPHARLTSQRRTCRANQKADDYLVRIRSSERREAVSDIKNHGQRNRDHRDRAVLPLHEGFGALPDGVGNALHFRRACI